MKDNTKNNFDNNDVITLTTADGEEVRFVEIAGIVYKGNYYVILQPLEGTYDEACVYKMTRDDYGDHFEIELDEEIVDAVFEKYNCLIVY